MSIPDMSDTILAFAQDVIFVLESAPVVNENTGVAVTTETTSIIKATIVPAKEEDLQKDNIDWSLSHLKLHLIADKSYIDNQFEYKGLRYKITSEKDYIDYGFIVAIAQEVK